MGQIHCQVTLPHKSLIAADNVINTFNFTGVDDTEDQATAAVGIIKAFYNDLADTQVNPVKYYFSGEINFGGARIKIYDLADPEPRVPILDESLGTTNVTPGSSTNLPGEVAVCLSYSAAAESGVSAARRRGRIYLGPLCTTASTGTTAIAARPLAGMLLDMSKAAAELASGPVGTQWCVWSRVNNAFYPIVQGYLDNAFDTQRRRGVATTTRTGWTGGLG